MPRPKGGDRCNGPYLERGGYRVRWFVAGKAENSFYATEGEAIRAIGDFRKALVEEQRTLGWALDRYESHMRDNGNKESSIVTTLFRLRALFPLHDSLTSLTPARAAALYEKYRTSPTRTGRPPAGDTQLNTLAQARTFADYCVECGWLKSNPFAKVKAKGRKSAGKKQLTVVEARALSDLCLEERSPAAAGALSALWLGMRCGEILALQPRDVAGEVVYIWEGKTSNAARQLVCPPLLGDLLREHVPFLNADRHWLRREVKRLCRDARVPIVTPHGLRGTHASIARGPGGATAAAIAAALGHGVPTAPAVTGRHYISGEAETAARQERVFQVLQGGAS